MAVYIEGSAALVLACEMSSEIATEKPTSTSTAAPKSDDIAAALDEARQNARLLRVSSSLFLREAKELIDADKVGFSYSLLGSMA